MEHSMFLYSLSLKQCMTVLVRENPNNLDKPVFLFKTSLKVLSQLSHMTMTQSCSCLVTMLTVTFICQNKLKAFLVIINNSHNR